MSVVSFSVGPSTHMSSVSTHIQDDRAEPPPRDDTPQPAQLRPPSKAPPLPGGRGVMQMDFSKWYLAMMETMMGFLSTTIFLKHPEFSSSIPLKEAFHRLKLLQEVEVRPFETPAAALSGGGFDLEASMEKLPVAVSQGLKNALSMMDRLYEHQLAKDKEWSDTWTGAHVRMAQVFASSSQIIRKRLADDLERVSAVSKKWEKTVHRMLASQRKTLETKVERMVRRWQQFLEQYMHEHPGRSEFHQVQLGMLETVRETLANSIRGRGGWCGGGGGGSFMIVVNHFVESQADHSQLAPPRSAQSESKMDTIFGKIMSLENQMVSNRKQRHRLWLDSQHDPETHMQRLSVLDSEYVDMEKELRVMSTIRQNVLRHRKKKMKRSVRGGASQWEALAWRFATPILELENHIFRFSSLSKRLINSISSVSDEVSSSVVASVKMCVQRMVHRLWAEIRQHLRSSVPPSLDKETLDRLHHEMRSLAHGHDIEPIIQAHTAVWDAKKRQVAQACRDRAASDLFGLASGKDSPLRRMMVHDHGRDTDNNAAHTSKDAGATGGAGGPLGAVPGRSPGGGSGLRGDVGTPLSSALSFAAERSGTTRSSSSRAAQARQV